MRAMPATAGWAVAVDGDLHALTLGVHNAETATVHAATPMFAC